MCIQLTNTTDMPIFVADIKNVRRSVQTGNLMKIKHFPLRLAVLLILSGILLTLSACGKEEDTVPMGEWLGMINEKFGMGAGGQEGRKEEKDAMKNAVQTALDWGIIDTADIDTGEAVTKEMAAVTLVKCVGMADLEGMSREDIAQFAVDNRYVDFPWMGRTDGSRRITHSEAESSLDAAFHIWTDRDYGAIEETVVLAEDVKDYSLIPPKEIKQEGDKIYIPAEQAGDIKTGDVFILPASQKTEKTITASANKAEQVEYIDGYAVITSEPETPEPEEVFKDLEASGSFTPDLLQCPITDGLGRVINQPKDVRTYATEEEYRGGNLLLDQSGDNSVVSLGSSASLDFEIDGVKVKGQITSNSVDFSLLSTLPLGEEKGNQLNFSKSYSVNNINFDFNYKFGDWWKLESAYAVLHYNVDDNTKVSFTYNKTGVFAPKYSNGNGKFPSNFSRAILKDSQSKGAKTIKICSIPIAGVGVANFHLDVRVKIKTSGSVELIITNNYTQGIEYRNGNVRFVNENSEKKELKASGNLEFTMYLGACVKALNFNIAGFGMEGGIGADVDSVCYLADTSNHLLDETVVTGGSTDIAEAYANQLNGTTATNDQLGEVTLQYLICTDFKPYGIIRLSLDPDCIVSKLTGPVEVEILGRANATIKEFHLEDGLNLVEECTRKFVPVEGAKDSKETESSTTQEDWESEDTDQDNGQAPEGSGTGDGLTTDQQDTENSTDREDSGWADGQDNETDGAGEYLDIDTYFVSMLKEENFTLKVVKLPEGCTSEDIVYTSGNTDIVTVDGNGSIKAVKAGTAEVQVTTTDGKYKVSCSVHVYASDEEVEFEPLPETSEENTL